MGILDEKIKKLLKEPPDWRVRASVGADDGAIPSGFPLVVDENSGCICQVILFYLVDNHLGAYDEKFVPNTVRSYAHDWCDWLQYTVKVKIPWYLATEANLQAYIDILGKTVAPQKGTKYKHATKSRRKTLVSMVYGWAAGCIDTKLFKLPRRSLLMPGVYKNLQGEESTRHKKIRIGHDLVDEVLLTNVLTRDQAARLLSAIGPLPSRFSEARDSGDSSKNVNKRIAAEIALHTGMRISEVSNLKAQTFREIGRVELDRARRYSVMVKGKGGKTRVVHFSGALIQVIIEYINGERAACANQSSPLLIINLHGQKAGNKTSVRTLQRAFAEACISVGLVKKGSRKKPLNDSWLDCVDVKDIFPLFSFHDLRSTFAVWTYYARKIQGDGEPWLYIQEQLGHAHLSTTLKAYLRAAGDFEAVVTDTYMTGVMELMAGGKYGVI